MYSVKFADIGEGIHEGILFKWLVAVGETVEEGQGLFMVETDKVTAEIPSPVRGTISETKGNVGDVIHVGNTIVVIDEGLSTDTAAVPDPENTEQGSTSVVGEIEVSSALIPSSLEGAPDVITEVVDKRKVLATPVARQLAKDLQVDISQVIGTGPVGRIMKEDIESYKAGQIEKPQPLQAEQTAAPVVPISKVNVQDELEERIKLTMRRRSIAKNMVQSKTIIPHAAAMDEIDVTELVAFRAIQRAEAAELGYKLTFMPFIIKAVILALQENPVLNASFDSESEEIILKKFYNIGLAVDDEEGLMVPVIHHADRLSVLSCAGRVQELVSQIKTRQITLQDLQGGTFTITNYGSVGALFGVPIIRYPEAAILGVGTIQEKPVVRNGSIDIRSIMPISVAFDHRIVDGGDAGRFLMSLKKYLSNPMLLMLK